MWTRKQYDIAGQQIGTDFVTSGGETSINDLSMKVASDASLNEEGIRTLVRLANVSAFESLFGKMAADQADDRMVDFVVGDPETVILMLRDNVSEVGAVEKTASYCRANDLYADLPVTPISDTVKVASENTEVLSKHPKKENSRVVSQRYKMAADRLRLEKMQHEEAWNATMTKASACIKHNLSELNYGTFEKRAASFLEDNTYGIELFGLAEFMGIDSENFINADSAGSQIEKIANNYVVDTLSTEEKRILTFVKEANVSRKNFELAEKGMQWLASELEKIEM